MIPTELEADLGREDIDISLNNLYTLEPIPERVAKLLCLVSLHSHLPNLRISLTWGL
jgi:hypothetical protein